MFSENLIRKIRTLLRQNKIGLLAVILVLIVIAFSSPNSRYLKDSNCKPGDAKIIALFKNFFGLPANAQTCSWTVTSVCTANSGPHFWKMDESSGSLVADSAGTNNGTAVGTTIITGKFGNARNFNGTSDYVNLGYITTPTQGTISAWIKPDGNYSGTYPSIISGYFYPTGVGDGITTRYPAICPGGDWLALIGTGPSYQYICSGQAYNSTNFPAGVWTHLAFTYDGSSVNFYKDGVLIKTATQSVVAGGNVPYAIGQEGNYGGGSNFGGGIDEVGLWNQALSSQAILNLYNIDSTNLGAPVTTFSWPPYSFPNSGACGGGNYLLSVTGTGGFSTVTAATNYISSLIPNTSYSWTVAAYDSNGSSCGYITTPALPGPQPFTTPACPVVTVNLLINGVHTPPPIIVTPGTSATLTWSSTNATSCTASGGWSGTQALNNLSPGVSTGPINASTTYMLTCNNSYSSASDSATANVSAPGGFTLSSGVIACNSVGLTWTASAGASGYRIYNGGINIATTTALAYTDYSVTQNNSYSYYIQAYNSNGTVNSNIVPITTPFCPPTVDLKCNGSYGPLTVPIGSTCSLTWSSSNATSCIASGGWSGSKALSGSETSSPINSSTTFILICTGPGGSTAPLASVIVNPTGFLPPTWIEIHP